MKAANLDCSVGTFNPMSDTGERPGVISMAEFDYMGQGPGIFFMCRELYPKRTVGGEQVLLKSTDYHFSVVTTHGRLYGLRIVVSWKVGKRS